MASQKFEKTVIASEARQSCSSYLRDKSGLPRRFAHRNDGIGTFGEIIKVDFQPRRPVVILGRLPPLYGSILPAFFKAAPRGQEPPPPADDSVRTRRFLLLSLYLRLFRPKTEGRRERQRREPPYLPQLLQPSVLPGKAQAWPGLLTRQAESPRPSLRS